jgi:hypothetical protein
MNGYISWRVGSLRFVAGLGTIGRRGKEVDVEAARRQKVQKPLEELGLGRGRVKDMGSESW